MPTILPPGIELNMPESVVNKKPAPMVPASAVTPLLKVKQAGKIISPDISATRVSRLIIVIVSIISTLPYFTVFRVFRSLKVIKGIKTFRVVKSFKLINDVSSLRTTFKGLVKAIPGILWTFCFLALFAYVYAIIGTNIFGEEYPEFFGNLAASCLSLCQILTFDSWVSQIARPIV